MKKIFVVGNALNYSSWIENHQLVDKVEEADIVLFTGGEDVDPSLYGCKKHPTTYSNLQRDLEEKAIFEQVRQDQICLGICRGSQFLCVMNGGLLVQNVYSHAMFGTHQLINPHTTTQYEITSTHHQMQYPFNLDSDYYSVLWSSPRRSDAYEGDQIGYTPCEPEVVLYKVPGKPKCLAIQGHPEMMRKEAPVIDMLNRLINKLLC
jgi:putative glutamine amidotransferase